MLPPSDKAGLASITLHEARHSAASYLIEAGLNDLELTAMIGHRRLADDESDLWAHVPRLAREGRREPRRLSRFRQREGDWIVKFSQPSSRTRP
jgi:hypothetical protein